MLAFEPERLDVVVAAGSSPPRSATWPWAATATVGSRRQAAWPETGRRCSRPSAPSPRDDAGQGVADPGSMLLAVSLLLREGLGEEHAADTLVSALREARADRSGSARRRAPDGSGLDTRLRRRGRQDAPRGAPKRGVRAGRRGRERSGRPPPLARGRGRRRRLRPPRRRDPARLRRDRARDDDPPRARPPRAGRRPHGRGLCARVRQGRRRVRHLRARARPTSSRRSPTRGWTRRRSSASPARCART